MIADYRIHTRLCRHAEGEPREYVERAVELGDAGDGFADHLPFLGGWSRARPHRRLGDAPGRAGRATSRWSRGSRASTTGLRILLRIEADFVPETLDDRRPSFEQYPFEYVIGRCTSSATASGSTIRRWPGVWRVRHRPSTSRASSWTRQAAEYRLFDVIGHFDHAKKFGPPGTRRP